MDAPPVQYVTTSDGYSIAYSVNGEGIPLVLIPEPVSHIQLYWTADTYMRAWLEGLSEKFRLILYDGRGQGMSGRGLTAHHSLADELRDLEAVTEHLGLDGFVLLSRSHVAVQYQLVHRGRLEALILVSMPISGRAWPSSWAGDLAQNNWEFFLQTLAGITSPLDQKASLERLQQATTQQDWLARHRAMFESDITELLGNLQVPVLVMHPRAYPVIAEEESRRLAAAIPDARLVLIDGASSRGDAGQGVKAIQSFLAKISHVDPASIEGPVRRTAAASGLSAREIEVLRLIAAGRSNQQIADDLVISPNTVARHVSNIFDKTGAANRAEAASYATKQGLV